MGRRLPWLALLLLLTLQQPGQAVETSGRLSLLGITADSSTSTTLNGNQLGLRLMADQAEADHEWSLHLRTVRQQLKGFTRSNHSSDLFRYRRGGATLSDHRDEERQTTLYYALDRALYRHHFDNLTVSIGRQPIDWGSGRFWQPINLFGAFTPTDLDTEYKPGIDALSVEWYPQPFSALTFVHAFAPHRQSEIDNSAALHYRQPIGIESEMALVAGQINNNAVIGGAFESSWEGTGWRIEGRYSQLEQREEETLLWIAGIEHLFSSGTLFHLEWYNNGRGATRESEMTAVFSDPLLTQGLQLQMGRQVIGVGLNRDLTPLLRGGYTLLGSTLRNDRNQHSSSLTHQLNLTYSISDESDLLISAVTTTGKGLSSSGQPQSEFGHQPESLTLRLHLYF